MLLGPLKHGADGQIELMDNPQAAAALNQLLDAEQQSLVRRVSEATPYLSLSELAAGNLVHSMADTCRHNCEQLSELILDLGGQPVPRRVDLATGNLHYLRLAAMLPQLVEAHEKLISSYREVAPRLAAEPAASALANQILTCHEADQERLVALLPASTAA